MRGSRLDSRSGRRALARPVAAAAVFMVLLLGGSLLHGQASPPDAAGFAQQAYHDAEAKDYAGAISRFQQALAAQPSNSQWRKDLAYVYIAAGQKEGAARELEQVYQEHPEQSDTAMQLGYLMQQLGRDTDAIRYFQEAQRNSDSKLASQAQAALQVLQAAQSTARRQRAYDLLAANRRAEAILAFESAHEADPSDAQVTLQLGYLYSAEGRHQDAENLFAMALTSSDPATAAHAKAALAQEQTETQWWFASIYAAPFYQSRFDNEINPVSAKAGLRATSFLQFYAGLDMVRDVRSRSGTLPEIYSDNYALLSVGVQAPIANTGLVLYAQAGSAFNLMSSGPLAIPDYRGGLTGFHSWGEGLFRSKERAHVFSPTASAYLNVASYSRYQDNVIGMAQFRGGTNLPMPSTFPVQVLAAVNVVADSQGQFYNNVVEAGPLLRFAPIPGFRQLLLESQYLRGFYIHRASLSPNPYGSQYSDVRVFLIWSQTF